MTDKDKRKKIWCLFSIDNNYDQPDNNLVAWWSEKPSLFSLAKALELSFPSNKDDDTLFVVNVWQGKPSQFYFGTEFRLEEVVEND